MSDNINTNPKEFAIKTIFIHYLLNKEIKQLLNKRNNIVIIVLLALLTIATLRIHFNDIASIISNGELFTLINISLCSPNIILILYWFIILIIFFKGQSYFYSSINNMKPILKRKLFHFLICILYIPAIQYMNRDLLLTLSLIMLYFFILIEEMRNIKNISFQNTPVVKAINKYLQDNIDNRDDSKFIITHIFLLTGVLSSLFYSFKPYYNSDYEFIGLIVLGIGDSLCSFIGVYCGRTMIYPPTKRTLEGTLGGLIGSISVFVLITQRMIMLKEVMGLVCVFIYEGLTLEIDNLVLPLFSNLIFEYISYYTY